LELIIISDACIINVLQGLASALARVTNYALIVTLQIKASLTDDSRDIIYDHNMFMVQATCKGGGDLGLGIPTSLSMLAMGCERVFTKHDTQHNEIQHTDTQHNDTQYNDIQHNNKKIQHSA
jgi:hypothetical protein